MRTLPVPSSITLAGLKSRWMTPRSCAAARPAQICRAISSAALLGEAADAAEQRREVLAVHVLHRQERVALDLVDVVDAADVRVRDLPRHPHFGVQLRQARRIAIDVGRQELQRDRLTELQVVGAEDLAHAAACPAGRRCGSGRRGACREGSGRDRWRRSDESHPAAASAMRWEGPPDEEWRLVGARRVSSASSRDSSGSSSAGGVEISSSRGAGACAGEVPRGAKGQHVKRFGAF